MNIFALHEDPHEAARMMCDKHVIKMILESAQLLSTAHRVLDGKKMKVAMATRSGARFTLPDDREQTLYKATHVNHPSAVWARESRENYEWLFQHFVALLSEYTFRYGKTHACTRLVPMLARLPQEIKKAKKPFELSVAMKDEYKVGDTPVEMYRHYYKAAKRSFAKWTKRNPPDWWS